ncbi:hypothetical protein ALQ60_101818 [Pseudomonas syringae pv. papulans]|nr:hypothetical protein ALO65_101933 [Pseudomonas syringae pv. papulans]RMN49357.1 hypothetical protein ALQ60_101818 [Pseudomonas syringae pv. papulans]RMV53175.1 hypothetical protein ALP11_102248 [Pseudomonas syringae pv. papulans]
MSPFIVFGVKKLLKRAIRHIQARSGPLSRQEEVLYGSHLFIPQKGQKK